MATAEIRVMYEELIQIAARFEEATDQHRQLVQQIQSSLDTLQHHWKGENATAFFSEMYDDVLPGLVRLDNALTDTGEATLRIHDLMQEAEEEAATLFKQGDFTPQSDVKKDGTATERLDKDGGIPVYRLNLNDPSVTPEQIYAQLPPNTDGRPIIMMTHGWTTSDADASDTYLGSEAWFEEKYGHLPESEQPILIGVDWDASNGNILDDYDEYADIENKAIHTGDVLGEVMARYQQDYPNGEFMVIGHSMGNHVNLNMIENKGVRVDELIMVQAAVGRDEEIADLSDELNSDRVGHVTVTHSNYDMPLNVSIGHQDRTGQENSGPAIGADGLRTDGIHNVDENVTQKEFGFRESVSFSGESGTLGHQGINLNNHPHTAEVIEGRLDGILGQPAEEQQPPKKWYEVWK